MKQTIKRWLAPTILDQIRPEWPKKKFLRDLLRRLAVDCVIDVGANEGQFAGELRTLGFTGQIMSFEPDPEVFERLKLASSADTRWLAFNEALGSSEGTMTLNVMAHSVFNSFRPPIANAALGFDYGNRIVRTVEVAVRRLDARLPLLQRQLGFSRPYLKLDTQGWDLEVFRGASAVHDALVGLQSEASVEALYDGSPPWHDAIETYRQAGFALAGLYSVHPGADRVSELDCFFVQERLVGHPPALPEVSR